MNLRPISALLLLLLSTACTSNPHRQQLEEVVKTNPLDMADQDAKTIVLDKKEKKQQLTKVPTIDARDAPFVAGKHSRIFHLHSCEYAHDLDSPIGFPSIAEAQRSGRVPCQFCHPNGDSQ